MIQYLLVELTEMVSMVTIVENICVVQSLPSLEERKEKMDVVSECDS